MANRKMLKIGEASELLVVTPATLRAWERTGELLPARKSKAGTRCYLESDLLGVGNQSAPTVRYARVSTAKQKADLDRQQQAALEAYCAAKGWRTIALRDLGSGINCQKAGLQQLLEMILRRQIRRLVLTHKDRLMRFGAELAFALCELQGIEVEGRSVWIPRVGWVKTREPLRFDGRIRQITIARAARRWYAVISVEVDAHPEPPTTGEAGAFGMDVGVTHMAILSDGRLYDNPKPLDDALKELRRVDKAIARSRNVHGRNKTSRRRVKLYRLRALIHDRVANLRRHYHRAVAADITKSAERIVVEDLNAAGIVKRMGCAAADVGLGGFLLEVAWQCEKRGDEASTCESGETMAWSYQPNLIPA